MTRGSALAALFFLPPALLRGESAAGLVGKLRSLRRAAAFRMEGRIVRIAAGGRRDNCQVQWRIRTFGETTRLFWDVTGPPEARVQVRIDAGEMARIRVGGSGEDLDPSQWSTAVLGAGLSYEDLFDFHLFWPSQTLAGEERRGARDCYVLRSVPPSPGVSQYESVTSWIDRETLVPLFVEKASPGGRVKKQFLFTGLHRAHGLWGARQLEVRSTSGSAKTLLIVTRASTIPPLTEADFRFRPL